MARIQEIEQFIIYPINTFAKYVINTPISSINVYKQIIM